MSVADSIRPCAADRQEGLERRLGALRDQLVAAQPLALVCQQQLVEVRAEVELALLGAGGLGAAPG